MSASAAAKTAGEAGGTAHKYQIDSQPSFMSKAIQPRIPHTKVKILPIDSGEHSARAPPETILEEVERVRLLLRRLNSNWIVDPHSNMMRYWDVVTFAALTFTAIVTPVEVAFTGSTTPSKNGRITHEIGIFTLNRIVDMVFLVDIVLQFFVAFYDETMGSMLIKSHWAIRKRYMRGWFSIDLISSIPFDVLGLINSGKKNKVLQFLKTLRLLRLLKLARVIRASRILARWEAAAVFTFSYAEISMYKFACKLLMWAHWMACLWGMCAHKDITKDGWNWMRAFEVTQTQTTGRWRCAWGPEYYQVEGGSDALVDDAARPTHLERLGMSSVPRWRWRETEATDDDYYVVNDDEATGLIRETTWFTKACVEETKEHFDRTNVMNKYFASLYFSVYTMTGIGYGDITATTFPEIVVATFIMLAGAVFWAYMIGEFVTLVSHQDVYGNAFRQRMDELNFMMADKKFSKALRRRCRMFLLHSKQHQRHSGYRQLERMMSISLRGEVALANNARWVNQVWFFKGASGAFVTDLSQAVQPLVYAPMEVVDLALTLFVITNGIAARKGRILSKNSVWGKDFMLDNLDLVDMICAAALSYLEVASLSRDRLQAMLENPLHVAERATIRHAVVLYTVRASFLRIGAQAVRERRDRELAENPDLVRTRSVWDSLFMSADSIRGDPTQTLENEAKAIAENTIGSATTLRPKSEPGAAADAAEANARDDLSITSDVSATTPTQLPHLRSNSSKRLILTALHRAGSFNAVNAGKLAGQRRSFGEAGLHYARDEDDGLDDGDLGGLPRSSTFPSDAEAPNPPPNTNGNSDLGLLRHQVDGLCLSLARLSSKVAEQQSEAVRLEANTSRQIAEVAKKLDLLLNRAGAAPSLSRPAAAPSAPSTAPAEPSPSSTDSVQSINRQSSWNMRNRRGSKDRLKETKEDHPVTLLDA